MYSLVDVVLGLGEIKHVRGRKSEEIGIVLKRLTAAAVLMVSAVKVTDFVAPLTQPP